MNRIEEAALKAVGTKTKVITDKRPCDQHCMATVSHILDLAGINDVYKGISCTDVANHWVNDPKNFKRVQLEDVHGGEILFFDGFDEITGDCDHVCIIVQFDGNISTGLCYVNGNGNNRDEVTEQSMNYSDLKKYAARIFKYIGDQNTLNQDEIVTSAQESISNPSKTVSVNIAQICKGNTGKAVRVLQALLLAAGYNCGSYGIDGDFGNDTKEAVITYQREHNLDADGIVGLKTWTSILN